MTGTFGVGVEGPLAPFAAGFEEALVAEGYSKQWARHVMGLAAEVSHWLGEGGLGAVDLTGEVIREFFAERGPSRSRCRTARSLRPIMVQLRSLGVAAAERTVALGRTDAEEELLGCYRRWCIGQRGLTSATADEYVKRVAVFLALWRPDANVVIAELDGRAVLGTVRAAAQAMAGPSLRCMVSFRLASVPAVSPYGVLGRVISGRHRSTTLNGSAAGQRPFAHHGQRFSTMRD